MSWMKTGRQMADLNQLSMANCQWLIVNESLPILARGAEFVMRNS